MRERNRMNVPLRSEQIEALCLILGIFERTHVKNPTKKFVKLQFILQKHLAISKIPAITH